MSYMSVLYLVSGIVFLYFGAEWLVKGSSRLALKFGISALVVGLTIVAFGTSAPELVVSVTAGLQDSGGIAIGNVIGSNIFNIAMILGIASLIRPLKVNIRIIKIDAPVLIILSLVLWYIVHDNRISRPEGIFLFAGIIIYTTVTVYFGKKESSELYTQTSQEKKGSFENSIISSILLIGAGLAGLIAGSKFFVNGAVQIAGMLGVSETVIGITIVAAGTSLPELATSVVASLKGEEDIAVGNIIGSNIFNILAILGAAGTVTPLVFSGIGIVDMAVMCGTALVLLPLMRTGFRINRYEGVALLCVYSGYMIYLINK